MAAICSCVTGHTRTVAGRDTRTVVLTSRWRLSAHYHEGYGLTGPLAGSDVGAGTGA